MNVPQNKHKKSYLKILAYQKYPKHTIPGAEIASCM